MKNKRSGKESSESAHSIARADWDFGRNKRSCRVKETEIPICMLYEYARESEILRALSSRYLKLMQGLSQKHETSRKRSYQEFINDSSQFFDSKPYQDYQRDVRYYESLLPSPYWSLGFIGREGFSDLAWSTLEAATRRSIMGGRRYRAAVSLGRGSDLEKLYDAYPQMLLDWIAKADAKDMSLRIFGPRYQVHPIIYEGGIETLLLKIDFRNFNKSRICEEFAAILDDLPCKPRKRSGTHSVSTSFQNLQSLGVMRVVNARHLDVLPSTEWRHFVQVYGTISFTERIKTARKTFKRLFPFDSEPLHYTPRMSAIRGLRQKGS